MMRSSSKKNIAWFAPRVLAIAVVAFCGSLLYSHDSYAAKPDITAAYMNDFCSTVTEYGYVEKMFLTNGSGTSLDENAPINVPIGATSVPVNFKIDLWYCKKRVEVTKYPVKTCRYAIVKETTTYTEQDCTKSWSNAPNNLLSNISPSSEMHYTTGAKTSPAGTSHYKMKTQVHSANLKVSSLKEGANRLCYGNSLTSMDPNGFKIYGGKRCITINIKFGWNLTVNSQNRVKGPSGNFSSYGNYHEGSTPRTVKPGDVVQWQHEIKNTDKGTATYERWRDRKGLDSSGYLLVGSHITNQKLAGGKSVRYPLDSSNVTYTIKQGDVGKIICERYAVKGRSSSNSSARYSTGSCVRVVVNWTISGTTAANRTTAKPGQTIIWTHTLTNNGPDKTHKAIRSAVQRGGFATNTDINAATTAAGRAKGQLRQFTTTHMVTQADVGKTLCQRLKWDPTSSTDTNSAYTLAANRCVTVPYNFTLVPNITVPENVEPGDTIPPVEGTITNRPPSETKTRPFEWQLNRFELGPGVTPPSSDVINNSNAPCSYYSSVGASNCSNPPLDKGTNTTLNFNSTLNKTISGQSVDVNTPIGTRICFSISVKPWRSSGAASWRHVYACLTVNKRPTIQVWGGDVRANYIKTSVSRGKQDGRGALFGSWVEYGALAVNPNVNYASGASLAKGSTSVSNGNDASLHGLTFANTGATRGSFGQYVSNANELTTQLANNATATSGSRTFAAGSIGKNTTQIIKVNGTATITGNLTYGGEPYSSIGQIPQRVIIADRIYIRDNVTRIDAWLIAPIIDTCSNAGNGTTAGTMPGAQMGPILGTRGPGQLVSDRCDKPLRVNGPVIASSVLLKRTGGSEPGDNLDARARAAEVFNLRPDAYLWLYNRFGGSGQMWTTGSRDLPPRF